MKAVVWGTGGTTADFLRKKIENSAYEIVAFTDNNPEMWRECWNGRQVIPPGELRDIDYDVVIICSLYWEEIRKQLINELDVDEHKIITYKNLEQMICNRFVEKYEGSNDKEIQSVLEVFRQGNPNILGSYAPEIKEYSKVYRDEDGFPYILFENKKMYYPLEYKFEKKDGMEVVADILYEQGHESPHLYIRSEEEIPDKAVIVDAGVCEGNFALRYIDKADKVYLIEADPNWMEALRRTFRNYSEKVVFCNKFLSCHDNASEITLDSLVTEKIDFLKMDIEGAEVEALLGARSVLLNSQARCAICSYHRQYDEKYISYILESYGYHVEHSKGYMFFPYDDNMVDTLDLRRAVIYGEKR